jgi:two-component system nitrogen regulation response regulator NtrX
MALRRKNLIPKALEELKNINWTGNVRELHNAVERMAILCDKIITAEDVQLYAKPLPKHDISKELDISQFSKVDDFKKQAEMIFVREKLKLYNWETAKTAKELNIAESDLLEIVKEYEIKK